MAEQRLSFVQRIARAFMSEETAAAMEAESRAWMARCPQCGAERSIWELGGIRAGAAGKPRRYLRCGDCGQAGWHRIYKNEGGAGVS